MIKRLVLLVLGATVITLLIASVALAATPQDIYQDFVDHNGTLTGTYTQTELRAFLDDATFVAYPPPNIDTYRQIVTEMLTERSTFPFTGFQLMIAGIVAVVLVGGGLALRRFSRSS
jgi:hypothetical protein